MSQTSTLCNVTQGCRMLAARAIAAGGIAASACCSRRCSSAASHAAGWCGSCRRHGVCEKMAEADKSCNCLLGQFMCLLPPPLLVV